MHVFGVTVWLALANAYVRHNPCPTRILSHCIDWDTDCPVPFARNRPSSPDSNNVLIASTTQHSARISYKLKYSCFFNLKHFSVFHVLFLLRDDPLCLFAPVSLLAEPWFLKLLSLLFLILSWVLFTSLSSLKFCCFWLFSQSWFMLLFTMSTVLSVPCSSFWNIRFQFHVDVTFRQVRCVTTVTLVYIIVVRWFGF